MKGLEVPLRMAVVVALAAPATVLGSTEPTASFRLSQAIQIEDPTPRVVAYLEVLDAAGEAIGDLEPGALSATIGEAAAETVALEELAASAEGVAYIFLVDISKSLSETEFDRIRGALDLWIASLGPADRVAVFSFGESSRLEVDFTNDYAAARRALDSLGPTDALTVFHRAVRDGLDLARRRDADLPGRRVLVVLTDGKDEGSGLTTSDLLSSVRTEPVPIYAIGFSRLRSPQERRRFLGLLHRLASNSGGAFIEAADETVEESYATMLAAVRRVWAATLVCHDCRLDGAGHRLQINLTDGDRVLSDGRRIRLLPVTATAVADGDPAPGTESGPPTADLAPAVDGSSDPALEEGRGRLLSPLWWVGGAVLLAGLYLAWRRLGPAGGDAAEEREEAAKTTVPTPPADVGPRPITGAGGYETAPGVLTSRPPKPPSLRLVRFIVVRGNRVGRQYSMMLLDRGVVGRRSTCDCVLVDEPGVEPTQFELYQVDGRVYIRDLARQKPTLVDGLPITERHHLDRETLIGNGDLILRAIYDEPRRVPL